MAASASGRICRDNDIRGEILRPITGEVAGCGISAPVRVQSIAGVTLNPAAIMTCDTAKATKAWLKDTAVPAWGRLGGGLQQLEISGSYVCRTRNSQPGAEISEHGKGRALDVRAFTLASGFSVSVEKGWNDPLAGKVLRQVHKGGCRPFSVVLGPDADRFHRDHLHFDTGRELGTCQ